MSNRVNWARTYIFEGKMGCRCALGHGIEQKMGVGLSGVGIVPFDRGNDSLYHRPLNGTGLTFSATWNFLVVHGQPPTRRCTRIPGQASDQSLEDNTFSKSDTASVKIPEIDLELAGGTLGGLVTTVEGLVTKISESLERVHGFTFGDSLDEDRRTRWLDFRTRLTKLLNIEEPWTLILDDALANSFIAPATDDIKDDHQLTFEEYERSWEQNEELGLNDMDTSSADAAYAAVDAAS